MNTAIVVPILFCLGFLSLIIGVVILVQKYNFMYREKDAYLMSARFSTFYDYVFGDGQYFYYNGLPEEVCTELEGVERSKAEELVLRALQKKNQGERPIRAAGYLQLKSAIPLLEKRLSISDGITHQNISEAIVWALIKIKGTEAYLDDIQSTVKNGPNRIKGLRRDDAIDLLLDFGKEPSVVDILFDSYLDDDISVRVAALFALRKIYSYNSSIVNLLVNPTITTSKENRSEIVRKIKELVKT